MRLPFLAFPLLLAACQQPEQNNAQQRIDLEKAYAGPSEPIESPDTSEAIWSPGPDGQLLFGNIGDRPFLSIACEPGKDGANAVRIVRHLAADAEAQAFFAFIGNGTMARIPVDATWRGNRWRWEGTVAADSPDLDPLTGSRDLYATLPGGGRLDLPASPLPGRLIAECRAPGSSGSPLPDR
ncbi:hypothetical protein QQS45_09455 [Alteriqipengyuania flavescens]|uniref:hypothetical protein n=1 Tax=Alteriqipengyuania flavescens TaxID=3053610 RepID=UPI0025B3D8CF|nr:hypothetical protein [Alteriqipengyuania flavescens]WJY17856.1 hypothetical protein QQW98_09450 [Alteriqipengyuania flavescens]WJY23797.1 hypothetical protein QQS45_09455 [Alteriqipengyuania flavescens]